MVKRISIIGTGGNFAATSKDFPNDQFQTIEDWKQFHIQNNTWGKAERWVRDTQEDISGAIASRPIEGEEEGHLEYLLPAQYTVSEEDVTSEFVAIEKQQKRIAFENFGKDFKRWVQILNEDSGVTPAQVLAIRADPRMKTANELAEGGDIPTLRYHIQNTDWTGLFPPVVVSQAIQKIDTFLGGWT